MASRVKLVFLCLTLCLLFSSVAIGQDSHESDRSAPAAEIERVPSKFVPNLIRVTSGVYSGGLPEGEAAFRELADLGIKTIVSVDGMKPDVETARRFGLRYVHLPHGYDGISDSRSREIAKAIRDLPGPLLVHCHHGKHRSPTAAAVACVLVGSLDAKHSESVLKMAGTSPHYLGLYQVAKDARRLSQEELDAVQVEFREVAEVPPLTETMVAMEHHWGHLQAIEKSQFQSPASHPDLVPAHEALLLRELYAEMLRSDETATASDAFKTWLKDGEALVRRYEQELDLLAKNNDSAMVLAKLKQSSQAIQANCQGCHRQFRDVPQR
ncbi:MAG: cytochrome c [Planctomycetaceae bacterium]|nr:cytochrome c [Planctomycetaceae bacterium]